MINSVSSCVGVQSLRVESVQSADNGSATTLNAPVPVALGLDCTLADDNDQNTEEGIASWTELTNLRYRTTRARASPIAALGQMSACIVHEINQPVTALLTNTEAALRFLDRPNPDLEESQRALIRVLQLGNRIAEIVRRTHALLQRVSPQKDDFEINQAIREIISLSQEDQIKNDVSVHTRLAQGLPLVRADQIQVQQVILNLITNAVEAMSGLYEGTRELCITTGQTSNGDVLVTVQDSGPGMDPQSSDHLFDAFYSTKPRGLGIGLSICRAIIEAHGGRLWASLSEPHGATFQFTLPQICSDRMPRALQRRCKITEEKCAASESAELRSPRSCRVLQRTSSASDQCSQCVRDRASSSSV
jgi:C4-dicarboxylate-specific signal transduction histidine kinase